MNRRIRFVLSFLFLATANGVSQDVPGDVKDRIDNLISQAYKAADAEFPCKLRGHGKPRILHWQDVDRCLNNAARQVDWDSLAKDVDSLAKERHISSADLSATIEASLTAHAVPFEKIFAIKDDTVFLPLTNSLLRFLAPDALQGLPVIGKGGVQVGTFSGVYAFERTGGLAMANTYRLTLFQYTDLNGQMQSSPDKLLFDSFGVPWKEAKVHRGFRLSAEKLISRR